MLGEKGSPSPWDVLCLPLLGLRGAYVGIIFQRVYRAMFLVAKKLLPAGV